jgi:hypothetical protein
MAALETLVHGIHIKSIIFLALVSQGVFVDCAEIAILITNQRKQSEDVASRVYIH